MTDADGARLSRVVVAVLGVLEAEAPSASADGTPAWDSLAHLNLLMAVEQEFGVQFGADLIVELDSVCRIRDAIDRAAERASP